MKLSSRQHEIIRIIFQSQEYVTTEAIADTLSLSTRTIKRELEEIGMFFETIGVPLEKKSGKGMKIIKDGNVEEILNSILDKKTIPVFSSEKRAIILMLTLLFSDEALKRFTLAKVLGTSELTVSSDLQKCEEILQAKGVSLVRKQGYGIYVVASEERRRVATFEIIEDATKGFSLLEVRSKTIEQFISRKELEQIAEILQRYNEQEQLYNSDRTRDCLALHLLLQKSRVEVGNKIVLSAESVSEQALEISTEILGKMTEQFQVGYSQGEIHFFADILALTQGVAGISSESETATYIAKKLTAKLESGFGILVDAENELFESLIRHLVATVNRSEKQIDVLNPILEEIKCEYPDIYQMVETCALEIKKEIGITFNSDEIGYLTLHMCVIAMDGKSKQERKYGALVVCPSGLVTSRLLAINVKKAFPNLNILETSSSIEAQKIIEVSEEIDVVISTIPINNITIPMAVVSPFVSPKDKDAVKKALDGVSKRKIMREVHKIETDMASIVVEKMQVKDVIADIISGAMVLENCDATKVETIISIIANKYGEDEESKIKIAADLTAREEIGSTIMSDGKSMLIHAKTSGVAKACFGVVRLKKAISIKDEQSEVENAIVMLAPQSSKQGTKVLSEISQTLILHEEFYQAIKSGKKEQVNEKIKEVLYNYYFNNFKE